MSNREKVLAKWPQARYLNLSNHTDGSCHCINDDYNDRYLAYGAKSRVAAWAEAARKIEATPMTIQQFNTLAHEIAQSTVRADIESYCLAEAWSGPHHGRWYDTRSADEGVEAESVARAVAYLEHWGELERNPANQALVRFRERAGVVA